MLKPNNYDNVQATGDFTPIILGGHHLIIKKVEEQKNRNDGDMIVVAFDMAPGDSQPAYFAKEFVNDIRPDKKWPRNGRQYINVLDSDGNTSRSFKSFINGVEKSNSGFVTQWGDGFAAQFKGKRIGGVFGEVENEYNGKTSMRHELRWFCADDKADTASIPNPKYLSNSQKTSGVTAKEVDGFLSIPEGVDEEVPF